MQGVSMNSCWLAREIKSDVYLREAVSYHRLPTRHCYGKKRRGCWILLGQNHWDLQLNWKKQKHHDISRRIRTTTTTTLLTTKANLCFFQTQLGRACHFLEWNLLQWDFWALVFPVKEIFFIILGLHNIGEYRLINSRRQRVIYSYLEFF